MDWFSCKGKCGGSDPTSDTVKVDASLLTSEKENVQPLQVQAQRQREEEEKRRAQEEHRLQMQKEAERRQVEEQARKRREAEEARRREQAAAERAAAEEAARAAAAKAKEEEQRRLEAERVANERARQEAEEAARLAEEKHQEELATMSKINEWCKENGFADMHTKKKGGFISPSKFPLHEAVAKRNEEIVCLLLQYGADATVKNSKGQTPADLARKMNKGGSMDTILAKLS